MKAFSFLGLAAAAWLALTGCSKPTVAPEGQAPDDQAGKLVALPYPEGLPPVIEAFILEQETGGERQYNRSPYPEWPQGESGVTWGIGYDATAQAAAVIRQDWAALGAPAAERLARTHPYRGQEARFHLPDVRDVLVPWRPSVDVFDRVDVVRTRQLCRRIYPGFDELDPVAQGVLISLSFNRGGSMVGDKRTEMRAIRALVPKRDYRGMAEQLRLMVRVWVGTSIYRDMHDRRLAEARLMESCAR